MTCASGERALRLESGSVVMDGLANEAVDAYQSQDG